MVNLNFPFPIYPYRFILKRGVRCGHKGTKEKLREATKVCFTQESGEIECLHTERWSAHQEEACTLKDRVHIRKRLAHWKVECTPERGLHTRKTVCTPGGGLHTKEKLAHQEEGHKMGNSRRESSPARLKRRLSKCEGASYTQKVESISVSTSYSTEVDKENQCGQC